jgi:hypothetical protein
MRPYEFTCQDCGATVQTYVFINYRTIPSREEVPTRCTACSRKGDVSVEVSRANTVIPASALEAFYRGRS